MIMFILIALVVPLALVEADCIQSPGLPQENYVCFPESFIVNATGLIGKGRKTVMYVNYQEQWVSYDLDNNDTIVYNYCKHKIVTKGRGVCSARSFDGSEFQIKRCAAQSDLTMVDNDGHYQYVVNGATVNVATNGSTMYLVSVKKGKFDITFGKTFPSDIGFGFHSFCPGDSAVIG